MIKSRGLRWTDHEATREEGRSTVKILTDKLTGKRLLGRPRPRWEEIVRMDFKKMGVSTRSWDDSVLDRDYWRTLMIETLNVRVP